MEWEFSEDVSWKEHIKRTKVVEAKIWITKGDGPSFSIFKHPPGKMYWVQANTAPFTDLGRFKTLRRAKKACEEAVLMIEK